MRTVWIIAGEASGDDYGAGLATALKRLDSTITMRGMGAEKMRRAGVDIIVDSTELGIVGLIEVLRHLPFFITLMRNLVKRAREERPDVVVLIDYPGFNIRFAQRLKKIGIPVVYYISPQVWAWKKGRIPKIAAAVTKMLCIFPFESAVYAGTGMPAVFVGHPLLATLAPYTSVPAERDPNLVVLLPGSRKSEYTRLMPVFADTMAQLLQRNPNLHFHIPLHNDRAVDAVKAILQKSGHALADGTVSFSCGDARAWMRKASAGIAASGTVTVESTILGCPLVVTYILNPVTWWIARRIVKLPWVSITNLVTQKGVFEEYLQTDATAANLSRALETILPGGTRRQLVEDGMAECVRRLGQGRDVAMTVAEEVMSAIV